jgi:Bacterial flagellin N-terminal helical region
MTTVGANFVSTHYLANSLVAPVMQAQSSLTNAMTEESTGEYVNLGLQLGDQSGYELSLKEQVGQLQTLTTGNSIVSTSLSTAQRSRKTPRRRSTISRPGHQSAIQAPRFRTWANRGYSP